MLAGLTGGIGSGKSTVAKLFSMLGWKHFDSDSVAKNLYFEAEIKNRVQALLGEKSYHPDGSLNKTFISALVFKQPELLKKLNSILHPAVGEKFQAFCLENNSSPILKESALLFEVGIDKQMDKVILVTAPDDLRIQRVMDRDKLSRELVLDKIKSQMPQEEKLKKADFVIMNDGEQSLIEQVLKTHEALIKNTKS
jgi:dephospho-CoA kinase